MRDKLAASAPLGSIVPAKNQLNTITSKCVIQPKFLERVRNHKLTLFNSEGHDENSSIWIWSHLRTAPCDEVTCIINCVYVNTSKLVA